LTNCRRKIIAATTALNDSSEQRPAAALKIAAPVGVMIRWLDGQLYETVTSARSPVDNITLIGDTTSVQKVTYAGESSRGSV